MKNQRALEEWLKGRELDLMTISEECMSCNRDTYIDLIIKFINELNLDKSFHVYRKEGVYEELKIKFLNGVLKYQPITYDEFLKKYQSIEKPKNLNEMIEDLDSGIQYIIYDISIDYPIECFKKGFPEFSKYDSRFVSLDSMVIERRGCQNFSFKIFNNLVLSRSELRDLISTHEEDSIPKKESEACEKMTTKCIWSNKDNEDFLVVAVYGDQLIMEEVSRNFKKKRYVVDKNTREILFKFKEA